MNKIIMLYSWTTVLIASCNHSTDHKTHEVEVTNALVQKACMDKVLRIDDSLGKIRNHAPENNTLSYAISSYVAEMKKINFKDCPPGFEQAFDKHGDAWEKFLVLSDKYPALRGEMHVLFQQIEKGKDSVLFKNLSDEIWSTWSVIESTQKLK